MTEIDLSPSREPAELIDAIWEVRRSERRDLRADLLKLLTHQNPTVREEVLSVLFVKWKDVSLRARLLDVLRRDPDFGVRSRAVGALGAISSETTRDADRALLAGLIMNRTEDHTVRKASYETLYRLTFSKPCHLNDDVDMDEDLNLDWVTQR